MLKKFFTSSVEILRDESGNLQSLTWVLGATVVTVLVIVLLMRIMPDTTNTFWASATQWMRGQFGF